MWPLRSFAVVLALASAAAPFSFAQTERGQVVIATGDASPAFTVELADDAQERARGLMYRRSMPREEGMLFDFAEENDVSFWMANTYIPLDMIFIRADGTIKSIAERTTPLSRRSIAESGVRYVLEINAGLSDELGIEPGDQVSGEWIRAAP